MANRNQQQEEFQETNLVFQQTKHDNRRNSIISQTPNASKILSPSRNSAVSNYSSPQNSRILSQIKRRSLNDLGMKGVLGTQLIKKQEENVYLSNSTVKLCKILYVSFDIKGIDKVQKYDQEKEQKALENFREILSPYKGQGLQDVSKCNPQTLKFLLDIHNIKRPQTNNRQSLGMKFILKTKNKDEKIQNVNSLFLRKKLKKSYQRCQLATSVLSKGNYGKLFSPKLEFIPAIFSPQNN